MKTQQKLKTQPRPLFSCSFLCYCTEPVHSPTATNPPPLPDISAALPPLPTPPQPPLRVKPESSSSSSSSSTSQSFTQWKFPHHHHHDPRPVFIPSPGIAQPPPPPVSDFELQEIFHIAELHLCSGSDSDRIPALQLLERSLVPNPPVDPNCSPDLMRGLVASLKDRATAKPAAKVLMALCLAEGNRNVAVEAGAASAVVETALELEDAAAERALAALELMCTVPEGAAEVRTHALAVPAMVAVMGRLEGRGREYAISVLAVIYGGGGAVDNLPPAPPDVVARAVALALEGDCTVRGRRKGTQLLKTLEEYGRLDVTEEVI